MTTMEEHIDRAETLLKDWQNASSGGDVQRLGQKLAAAQVHATLALVAATRESSGSQE